MAIISTINNKRVLNKLAQILITPYVGNTKGTTTYALDNVVADSTSVTQDDPDRQAVDCETRDEPITEAITLGSYQFTCDSADWQDDLLENVLGWTKEASGEVLAPSTYREVYAEIELQFDDPSTYSATAAQNRYRGSIVLPKVLLSSKATLESLKTSTGNMTVAGTAYSGAVGSTGKYAPIYFSPKPINVTAP